MLTEPKAATSAPIPAGEIEIRRLRDGDSIEELTALLHRAYRAQVEMGLRPLAGRQDAETTGKRCTSGECFIALLHPSKLPTHGRAGTVRLVGTILFHEVEGAKGPPWFQNPFVDSFSQFGVDPHLQGRGIGRLLLEVVERRARDCGATELGLSMAEPDTGLMEFYKRRGYRFIEHWQWPYTNYRSAILSKTLGREATEPAGQ